MSLWQGKRQEARGFRRFYISLHSLVLLCSPTYVFSVDIRVRSFFGV
ncbi:MAG: hypothetical protein HEQ20_20885 [Aphanizomenon flos-aquae KM1D3_PB]|nr:MAG: hypothetical protein HEQ20_20885 [Aphanizomenon flos-aquae KM1D3_PB]